MGEGFRWSDAQQKDFNVKHKKRMHCNESPERLKNVS